MPRNDPLGTMRLILRIESDQARTRLGQVLRLEAKAEADVALALGALAAEAAGAAAGDYAGWLPAGQQRLAMASAALMEVRADLAPALAAVAKAETGREVLAAEARRRDLRRRSSRQAKEQRLLEDFRPAGVSRPEP
jgi:hypothetical protein